MTIGPYNVIEDNVTIGNNVSIGNFNTVCSFTEIGENCQIFHNNSLGAIPQDKKFEGEKSKLLIGKNTIIREFVTINRGTKATGVTLVGDDVLIMAYVHIAHDCIIGHNSILVNLVTLGGHVEIGDWAIMGGASNAHQFCRIGQHAMVAANSKIVQDIPPYILAGRHPVQFSGINALGLQRRGFSDDDRLQIKRAYKILFKSDLNQSNAIEKIKLEFPKNTLIDNILDFVENSKRGII